MVRALACLAPLVGDVSAQEATDQPESDDSVMARLDLSREVVSESLDAFARKLDAFFYDERYFAEDASTRLRLGQYVFNEQGAAARWRTRFNLAIKLPNLNRKVKLFVGTEDADTTPIDAPSLSKSVRSQSDESFAGVRFYAKTNKKLNLSMATGVKVENANLFAGPRLRYTQALGDWLGRFTEQAIYITRRGWESTTRFDLEQAFSSRMFLRHTIEGRWRQEDPGYRIQFGSTLFHQLPEAVVMAYGWTNQFRTRPQFHFDDSVISVEYRRAVWRKWLYVSAEPQIAFYNGKNFNPTAGIWLGFDVIFGK